MSDSSTTARVGGLTFVRSAGDVPPPKSGWLTVVLDATWTPEPGGRPDVTSVRPYRATVVGRHDLFGEALAAVDRWGDATGMPDRLVVEGVAYWFRVRESLWHWAHERLYWRLVLAAIEDKTPFDTIVVPEERLAVIDVARALDRPLEIRRETREPAPMITPVWHGRRALRGVAHNVLRWLRRRAKAPGSQAISERRRHTADLDFRADRLSRLDGPRVVVLTHPGSYQRIGSTDTPVRRDPNLGAVIPELEIAGLTPIVIGWGMDPRTADDWALVEEDERLLPASFVRGRWGRPEDADRANRTVAEVLASLDAAPDAPLDLAGVDLSAAFRQALSDVLAKVVRSDIVELASVERLVGDLCPAAMVMTQEHHRTAWLLAGARAGVPTFALQHGVLYASHPGYPPRRHPGLVLPTRTFVFGDYERRVLLSTAYDEDRVEVSGSPRLDLDAAIARQPNRSERDAVRRELGVAAGDRMLVVSTTYGQIGREIHLVHMLETVLGGPLPRVHVVFKQHPGERDEGPYRGLLVGMARAGGYEPPPVTIVKNIDLHRLLRAADAHLGLQSTVLADAVVAGTPNLIATVEAHSDIFGYVRAGVARPVGNVTEVLAALDDPWPPDPVARQAFLDDHYRSGDASALIAAAIAAGRATHR